MPHGPDVLELLARRRAGHRDEYVVGITVEGGGMRGVVSGAMLIALRDLGLAGLVDRWYGTSAGAIDLAYFAADAGWDALAVYYDLLVDGFVRVPRPGRPVLDMGRVEAVLRTERPLALDAIAASPHDVRFVLTDVDEVRPVVVDAREVAPRLPEHLLAAAWLPILAGRPRVLEGRRCLDGGLLWPDPLYAALADGCTHVLALGSSTAEPERPGQLVHRSLGAVLERWSPGLGAAYLAGRRRWDNDRPRLEPGRPVLVDGASVVRVLAAAGDHGVTRLTRERGVLLDGARIGYRTVHEVFGKPLHGPVFAVVGP